MSRGAVARGAGAMGVMRGFRDGRGAAQHRHTVVVTAAACLLNSELGNSEDPRESNVSASGCRL